MTSAVAYYRAFTQRQGRSGLGIEAQRTAVSRFAEAEGISLLSEFAEVETGKVLTHSIASRATSRLSPA